MLAQSVVGGGVQWAQAGMGQLVHSLDLNGSQNILIINSSCPDNRFFSRNQTNLTAELGFLSLRASKSSAGILGLLPQCFELTCTWPVSQESSGSQRSLAALYRLAVILKLALMS